MGSSRNVKKPSPKPEQRGLPEIHRKDKPQSYIEIQPSACNPCFLYRGKIHLPSPQRPRWHPHLTYISFSHPFLKSFSWSYLFTLLEPVKPIYPRLDLPSCLTSPSPYLALEFHHASEVSLIRQQWRVIFFRKANPRQSYLAYINL